MCCELQFFREPLQSLSVFVHVWAEQTQREWKLSPWKTPCCATESSNLHLEEIYGVLTQIPGEQITSRLRFTVFLLGKKMLSRFNSWSEAHLRKQTNTCFIFMSTFFVTSLMTWNLNQFVTLGLPGLDTVQSGNSYRQQGKLWPLQAQKKCWSHMTVKQETLKAHLFFLQRWTPHSRKPKISFWALQHPGLFTKSKSNHSPS